MTAGLLAVSTEEEFGSASTAIAFVIVVLLGVAVVFLWRNMRARIDRLPKSFPQEDPRRRDEP